VIQKPIFLPSRGQVLNVPEQFLVEQYSPYSRNIEFFNQKMQGRYGLGKFSTTVLSGAVLACPKLEKLTTGAHYTMFCTKKDIYSYDFSNSRFDILTPLYQVGTVKVVNGSAVVRGGLSVDNCDDAVVAWVDGSGGDVTPSRDTSDKQDGTASVKLTVGAGAGVELLAYHDIASVNLTAYDSIGFWIKSTVALSSGDLQFLVDNTAACASPLETINIPAVSANTWTWVNLPFVTPANLTAVISIGIKQAVDKGAMVLNIDQIVVGDWSDQLGVGDFFKIGSGSVHTGSTWYEILTVDSDTQLTLTAVYAGSSVDQSAYVARLIFTGSNSNVWDWTQFEDDSLGSICVMTNGVDTPVYWNGSGQVVALTGLATGFTAAKYVDSCFGRIIFANTTEGGAQQTQRRRYSMPYNANSYDDDHFGDLVDEPTQIMGMCKFANIHIIFKENEAYLGSFVGGDEIISYVRTGQCAGTRSNWSIIVTNNFIAYFGGDKKFHRWNLLQDDIISETLFPDTKDFNPTLDRYVQGAEIPARNQLRWFCPKASSDVFDYVFVWDYQNNIPGVWEYAETDACCSFGSFLLTDDVYADDAIYGALYADETSGYADDSTSLENSRIPIYGGWDGIIRICDSGVVDDGTSYTRTFRFKRLDFGLIGYIKRLCKQQWWLDAESAGSITVKMRLDDRITYESLTKTVSLISSDTDKDIIKVFTRWDIRGETFQPEISATVHFALIGVINYIYKKGSTFGG
jgi:hypothetical protein